MLLHVKNIAFVMRKKWDVEEVDVQVVSDLNGIDDEVVSERTGRGCCEVVW